MATAVLHNIACDESEEVPLVNSDIEAAINVSHILPHEENYYNVSIIIALDISY